VVEVTAGETNGGGARVSRGRAATARERSTSPGFSYVEVLVAVVVVGITVIATLVGLRTTVVSGRVGAERSQLLLWAQEGAEALHRSPYVPCGSPGTITTTDANWIRGMYQGTLDTVSAPSGMIGGSLTVGQIDYLSIDPVTWTERWHDRRCDPNYEVTRLDVRATSGDGTVIDLEVFVDG